MKRILLAAMAGVLVGVMALGSGCYRVPLNRDDDFSGPGRTETGAIDLEGAERLSARLRMGVGELRMSSAEESGAVATDFEYGRESWKPRVSYDVTGDTGHLEIRQPDNDVGLREFLRGGRFDGAVDYSWDIGLPKGVPTDLQLDFGVGDADVDLSGLLLEELRVNAGVGDVTVDLGGDWTKSFDARIEAGVGDLTLRVPRGVGVRVTGREDGLGQYRADGMKTDGDAYVNDAYGTSPVTLDIELRRGVGDVTVELVD